MYCDTRMGHACVSIIGTTGVPDLRYTVLASLASSIATTNVSTHGRRSRTPHKCLISLCLSYFMYILLGWNIAGSCVNQSQSNSHSDITLIPPEAEEGPPSHEERPLRQ